MTDWVKVEAEMIFECAACTRQITGTPVINKTSGETICQECALRVSVAEDVKVEGRP